MQVYLDVVILLNILVDFFLLLGSNYLSGYSGNVKSIAVSAVFGGVYAGFCMVPSFRFLGHIFWRVVFLAMMSVIAFGVKRSSIRRGIVFLFLSMALGGVATGIGKGGFFGLVFSAAILAALCVFGLRGQIGQKHYVQVEIYHGGKCHKVTALHDTGNSLVDPVTGLPVLVVGPEIAWDILGLTAGQLQCPVTALEQRQIQGVRLIPYRAVGCSSGMLLGMRFEDVKIDGKSTNQIVAFSPNRFENKEGYQALAGGVL